MILKITQAIFAVLLINSLGIVGHTSAMPMTGHDQMQHATAPSSNCATVCSGIPVDKKREFEVFNEEDDEPQPPYFLQFHSARTDWFSEKKRLTKLIEQPDNTHIYKLCCTIRR